MTSPTRAAGAVAAALGAAVLAGTAYQEIASALDRRRYPPPGRMVNIGGRRLHLTEAGEGSPPVVIIPALGDSALLWEGVQRELADTTRVYVYDRAGIGWSDPARGLPTPGRAADDLRALLTAAAVEAPVILAAHSVGGIIARRFAARWPDLVAGIVLIDSSHENQAGRYGVDGWPYRRSRYWQMILGRQARPLGLYRLGAALGLRRGLAGELAREALPESAGAYRAYLLSTRRRRVAVRELVMMAALSGQPPSLGSIPLSVLTASDDYPGWASMQAELGALSTDSTHTTAEGTGHYIHLDDPAAVVRAIREMTRRAAAI